MYCILARLTLVILLAFALPVRAQTIISSANDFPWDVEDNTGGDTGAIGDGGGDAFDAYGSIRIRVLDASSTILTDDEELSGFGLEHDGGRRWETTTPATVSGVEVSRALFAPSGTNYMRYVDTFTNMSSATRQVLVAWGGNLGSNGETTVAATSSGDLIISRADVWAVTIQNRDFDPAGPTQDPPVGYALGSPGNGVLTSVGEYTNNPFETPWPGNGNDTPAYVYHFTLGPSQSASLAYFLFRGGPIALAKATLKVLVAFPNFCGLSIAERAAILNWKGLGRIGCH
jgi:hypothetical protein